MGNHGGGIPKGGKAKDGHKGVSAGSADHGFHVGDHVRVNAGLHSGIEGKIRRTVGLNHVHIIPKAGRGFIAHVKNIGTVGISTKHTHIRVGLR